ncbi:MAG: DUF3553 domain-containing protein [Phycisphaerales bacterium]|nr:DUF3553 domain-containing protein [Phycisphaerales bacterium]
METSLTQQIWSFGDKVVHTAKPEWGAGVVTAASSTTHEGRPCQSLTIRFDRAGIKTISTAFAKLVSASSLPTFAAASASEPADAEPAPSPLDSDNPLVAKDPREVMSRLPDAATDPFGTPEGRLLATLALYRFTPTGASLLDWAAAQSGLADPMSRFNRHELERFFESFVIARDNHLKKLATEMKRTNPTALARAVAQAPASAQQALRRIDAMR